MTSAVFDQLNLRGARIALIAAGVILAIGLAMWQAMSPKLVMMALAAIALTVLAICKMEAAIVVYTLISFTPIGPFFGVTGRFGHAEGLYPCELMLGLLLLVWGTRLVFQAVRNKRLPLQSSPINLPLGILIGAAVFSFVAAQFTWDYRVPIQHRYYITQIAELGLLCMPVAVYLLVSNSLKDLRWVKAVFCSVLIVGVLGASSYVSWIRAPSFLNLAWGGLLPVPLISFLYAYVVLHKEFDLRQFVAICLLAGFLCVQFKSMSWVVMWLSASVSLCVISWSRSKRLFAAVFVVAALTCLLKRDLFAELFEAERVGYSFERLSIWGSSIKIALGRLLWGVGPDNFYPYYSHYYANVFDTLNVTSPHSNWAQIFVQYGVIGFIAFVWFIVACFLNLSRLYRKVPGMFEKTVLLAITGTFAGIAVISGLGDYLFPTRANRGLANFGITVYVWILLGVAFALGEIAAQQEDISRAPGSAVVKT